MDVDLLKPGTVPISPDTVLGFEFLLDKHLLLNHLQKPNPDPSPIDLITKFYDAIAMTLWNRIEPENIEPNVDGTSEVKLNHPAKNIAMKILSLKVAAYLNWNLAQIRSLPFKTQISLLQDLMYFTSEEKTIMEISNIEEPDTKTASPQFLFALLLFHRWLLSTSMHKITSNWQQRYGEEFCAQICYDLGTFFFYQEDYEAAKQHFSKCQNYRNSIKIENGFVAFDREVLNVYVRACDPSVEMQKKTLLEQLNNSIVNQFMGITNILQQDNLQRDIPLAHRINLELDIQGALSSGIFTVARDLLYKVKELNYVRCILDRIFLNEFSLALGKNVDAFLWAIQVNWKSHQSKDKTIIKEYIFELIVKEEVPDLTERIKSIEVLANVFDKAEFKYFGKKEQVASIPEHLFRSEPAFMDTTKKRKPRMELRQFSKQLISSYDWKEIKDLLTKIGMINLGTAVCEINPQWELPIPLQSVIKGLPRGQNTGLADGNSMEGDSQTGGGRPPPQPGTNSYKNFDHLPNRDRSNSSMTPCLPTNEGPPPPCSPISHRRQLLNYSASNSMEEERCLMAPLAQDETQLLPGSPMGYISPSVCGSKTSTSQKKEPDKVEEFPSEFECCFCNTKNYKEFVDAEGLMSLATSDFRQPVCMEMQALELEAMDERANTFFSENYTEENVTVPARPNGVELASMDSSDTFATCTTYPNNSQADLTADILDSTLLALDSNLYINPLDKSIESSPAIPPVPSQNQRMSAVKKSASGDTALRSLGSTPVEEKVGFRPLQNVVDRGSRNSLDGSPGPRKQKTRFQLRKSSVREAGLLFQLPRPPSRTGEGQRSSQDSLEKRSKQAFGPGKGLASAARILNHHLFGENPGSPRSGRNSTSKSSLSVDSMDSRETTTPQMVEPNRRSRSILKKADSCGNGRGKDMDPESERLISDNGSGMFDGSNYSPVALPNKLQNKRSKMQSSAYQQELDRTRTFKSQLLRLDDIMNKQGDSAQINQVPLYICPPPPPIDSVDFSPTEETHLLSVLGTMEPIPTSPQVSCHYNRNERAHPTT